MYIHQLYILIKSIRIYFPSFFCLYTSNMYTYHSCIYKLICKATLYIVYTYITMLLFVYTTMLTFIYTHDVAMRLNPE